MEPLGEGLLAVLKPGFAPAKARSWLDRCSGLRSRRGSAGGPSARGLHSRPGKQEGDCAMGRCRGAGRSPTWSYVASWELPVALASEGTLLRSLRPGGLAGAPGGKARWEVNRWLHVSRTRHSPRRPRPSAHSSRRTARTLGSDPASASELACPEAVKRLPCSPAPLQTPLPGGSRRCYGTTQRGIFPQRERSRKVPIRPPRRPLSASVRTLLRTGQNQNCRDSSKC